MPKNHTLIHAILNGKSRWNHGQKIGAISELNPIFRNVNTITAVV